VPLPNNFISPFLKGKPLPPPYSDDEMKWLTELFRPEEEYYKIYSPRPAIPPKGMFLLLREPLSQYIRVVWPSGEFEEVQVNKRMVWQIGRFGMAEPDVERALDYLWNFGKVYIRSTNPEIMGPPIKLKAVD
jgi:hypothetical protein